VTRHRRALTLLETLIASAILATLAGACVPLLSAALHALAPGESNGDDQQSRSAIDLARLADTFMRNPGAEPFGVKNLPTQLTNGDLEVRWPKDFSEGARPRVTAHALRSCSAKPDHLWIVFECQGQKVMRYLELPKPKKEQSQS
jgi:hypothetical protein